MPAEIGAEKTGSQHVGNAAFGMASLLGTVGNISRLAGAARVPFATAIPGLNLVAAGVEGANAYRKYRQGETVVALTSTGNSVGCLSAFMAESSLLALRLQKIGLSSGLAAVGGLLGLVAGTIEVRQGQKIRKQNGSSRTLSMGVLDLASGVSSLAGAAVLARSRHKTLGMSMLIGSGIIDLAGIGVDYLWPTRTAKE